MQKCNLGLQGSLFFTLVFGFIVSVAQPVVTSFSPLSGTPGTNVTISGSGFNTTAANNAVYFGGVRAQVTAGTATSITVVVPPGAITHPISVTNTGTWLQGVSTRDFEITIPGGLALDANSFGSSTDYTNISGSGYMNQGGNQVLLGDLDGDGKADWIVGVPSAGIRIYRNLSTVDQIAFSNPYSLDYGVGLGEMGLSDMNGDGKTDIFFNLGGIRVLLNQSTPGSLSFAENGPYALPDGSGKLAVTDLDRDGRPDLMATNPTLNSFSMLRNTGTAGSISFAAAQNVATGTSPLGIAAKDLNNDGKNDIVVVNSGGASISVFRNTTTTAGTITLAAKTDVTIPSLAAKFAGITDVDSDGKPDILVSGNETLSVFKNTSTTTTAITLATRQDISTGSSTSGQDMVIGDFDGDGNPDFALSGNTISSNTSDVRVFRNTSAGGVVSFSSFLYRLCGFSYSNGVYYGCTGINSLAVGDLNNDGKPDLATAQEHYSTYRRNIVNDPAITNFSPTSGTNGTTVSIAGRNFTGATAVSFGDVPAASFTVNSATSLTALVGAGATGKIQVTTPRGKGASAGIFTYYAMPTITSFTPTTGGPGTAVTITGTNFSQISSVKFGGVEKTALTVQSTTQMVATVGSGASGAVTVTNPAGTATLAGFTFVPTPTISSFTPTSAGAGTTVTITGNNLQGATAVKFGNVNAASFTVVSNTSIQAVVAPGSSGGNVSVTTPGGTASLAGFTFIQPPAISSFTPINAISGATVTITGSNFTNASAVSFGGVPAASFSVVNSTSITAVVGAGATGVVSVTTPGGTATRAGFTHIFPPFIHSFSPTMACEGNTITIMGKNFLTGASVRFGGFLASSVSVPNDSTILAVMSASNNDTVWVSTAGGLTYKTGFRRLNAPGTFFSFTPSTAGTGDTVTLSGSGFTSTSLVRFGGTAASYFNVENDNTIKAVVGNGASGQVAVTNLCGTNTGNGTFTYVPAPFVQSFNPLSAGKGTSVFISGNNLVGATAVSFGGVPAQSYTITNGVITAVVGNGASGDVAVTTVGGSHARAGFTFVPAPVIQSFTPTTAATGAQVTITGNHFTGATAVRFGGQMGSFTVVNATTITATVPFPAASGDISVTTPGGTGTLGGFTYIPRPTIGSFTPTSAQQGQTVTISGINFSNASLVSFGGVAAASFTVVNSTTITAVVGPGASGDVVVTTPGGSGSRAGFTFVNPAPVISSFSPSSGGTGTVVSINGSHFTNAGAVSFGGTSAASFTINHSGSITAIVGAGSTGSVSVTTPGGSASLNGFTFYPAPTITGFSPSTGKAGDSITITGTNLNGTMAIRFGGVDATGFRVVGNTSVKARLGTGATGIVSLTTPGGTANLAGFTFTGPTISGFAPEAAKAGDTVSISGTNLSGITRVLFGGNAALSFLVVNSTTIKAVVAAGASGKVSAIAGSDTASKDGFTFLSAPLITGFSPVQAGPGIPVTIKGRYFTNTGTVHIGETAAKSFVVLNDSTIKAETGQATQGGVTVTTPGGTASLAGFVFEPGACTGGTAYIASNISGGSYQWQVNTGEGFTDISNGGPYAFAQTAMLRISNLQGSMAGYQYRCRVGAQYSTTFFLHITNEWKGTQNNVWENAANWQCGLVPDSNSEVTIRSGTVIINSEVRIRALKLDSSATLQIAPGKRLIIDGRQALPAKIEKVGMAAGHHLLHANTPGLLMKTGESAWMVVRKFGNETSDSIPQGLVFNSSHPTVAQVNASGLVQALQPGYSLVEATDAAGKKAYVSVQVFAPEELPANNEPVFAGFKRPLYIVNTDVGATIPITALNRLGQPLNLPVSALISSSAFEKEFEPGSRIHTPEGGFAIKAKTGGKLLMGEAVMLALSAQQSQGFGSAFLTAGTQGTDIELNNAYSTPPPGLPQIFHVSIGFGIYPVIFTNKGLTSEPVWGNVFRLISYPIMFGQFWTGAYGIDILVLAEEVPVQVETGVVASAAGSRLVSKNPGIEKWRVIPENFLGSWNQCQVYADYSGDWCSANDTYGHSIRMRIPKAPDRIFYEGPRSVPYPSNSGYYYDYYKTFTGVFAPGQPQVVDGHAQYTDNSTGVTTPKTRIEIGPYREVVNGLGFFNSFRTKPLQEGDVFAGMYLAYRNRSARLSWVHQNEFDFEVIKPIDETYSAWIDGAPFVRCNVVFAPQITGFSPGSGGAGTTVTITGSDFTGATVVTFGGTPAASFVVINDQTITAVLGPNGSGGLVRVTTAGGTAVSEFGFTYIYPPPVITSFTPASGEHGTVVTITGSNFTGATAVGFGGVNAKSFTVVNDNTITAVVSSNGASGNVAVKTPAGEAIKPGFTFNQSTRGFFTINTNSGTVSFSDSRYFASCLCPTGWTVGGDSLTGDYSKDQTITIYGPYNELNAIAGKTYPVGEIFQDASNTFCDVILRIGNDFYFSREGNFQGEVTINRADSRCTGTLNNVLLFANYGFPNQKSVTINGTFDVPLK